MHKLVTTDNAFIDARLNYETSVRHFRSYIYYSVAWLCRFSRMHVCFRPCLLFRRCKSSRTSAGFYDLHSFEKSWEAFCVLLTVHLSIILGNVRLDTHLLDFTIGLLWSSTFFLIFVVPCIMLCSSEISPTWCNNCVYSSQWLYSTCFGWQFHPSSGVQCCIWPFR